MASGGELLWNGRDTDGPSKNLLLAQMFLSTRFRRLNEGSLDDWQFLFWLGLLTRLASQQIIF